MEANVDPQQLLQERLLPLGGARLVWPGYDEALREILERGRAFDGTGACSRRGIPSRCHENVAHLWEQGENQICTGYALSDDGLWRQHSWLLDADGTVIETTEPRVLYFGYVLTDGEADEFYYDNW